MQTSDRVLAWRYGRALFLAAGKDASRVHADLSSSHAAILDALPVLRHPRVSAADKKKKLAGALGDKVSALTRRFLELLVDKKRFSLYPLIAPHLARLIAEQNNTAKAQVRTARALSAQDQERLKKSLKAFSGRDVDLDVKEDPELLGGVVVRLGDWVLDSSLRGRLKALAEGLS